jgi:hypothetical protein
MCDVCRNMALISIDLGDVFARIVLDAYMRRAASLHLLHSARGVRKVLTVTG